MCEYVLASVCVRICVRVYLHAPQVVYRIFVTNAPALVSIASKTLSAFFICVLFATLERVLVRIQEDLPGDKQNKFH